MYIGRGMQIYVIPHTRLGDESALLGTESFLPLAREADLD